MCFGSLGQRSRLGFGGREAGRPLRGLGKRCGVISQTSLESQSEPFGLALRLRWSPPASLVFIMPPIVPPISGSTLPSFPGGAQVPQHVTHLHRFVEDPIEFLAALKFLPSLFFGQSWPLGIDVFTPVVLPLFTMAVRDLSRADHLGSLGIGTDPKMGKDLID